MVDEFQTAKGSLKILKHPFIFKVQKKIVTKLGQFKKLKCREGSWKNLYPLLLTFVHFYPLLSTPPPLLSPFIIINCSSTLINFNQLSSTVSTFILIDHFHPLFIQFHPLYMVRNHQYEYPIQTCRFFFGKYPET